MSHAGMMTSRHRTRISEPDWDIVQRATDLFPLIRAAAQEGQLLRQITTEVTDALRIQGLLGLVIPSRLGGLGGSARTMVDTLAEIGRADGSAGWTAALINACSWFGTTYGARAQHEIWGTNPTAAMCGIFFPGMTTRAGGCGEKTEDGYIVSGEYAYASGSAIADWATLGMSVTLPDGSDALALGLVPSSDWTIKDTWYTVGMRGTGSNTLVVKDAFIPEYRVQTFDNLSCGLYETPFYDTEALSRQAFLPMGTIILAAPQLGLACAALDYVLEKVPAKPVGYTVYQEAKESPTHQLAVADAASKIDAAYLLAARAASDMDAWAEAGIYPDALSRARIRMDTGHIVRLCMEAIDQLMTAVGAGAFAQDGTLGRIWRDANTGGRHAFATPEVGKEVYGRLLLGTDRPLTINV
ncbi:acyl-CoA dehydrogenase [Mycobacteroides abscessus subsp. bolletii]|uniref:acyl-CoA dehydrogenase family protein n=1 Tax=Mycobacteroides abscessus TaxID=36809 RepID=UPI0009A58D40|nr:acyl-CoA dehydrogenase family protein [Mycobacteroides abscessus]SKG71931.1 acyl-CoA dehydrogenase [Mycobacteroides abscessus subsp. bolletii]SKH10704.1 acyl-CoA dehydrogenase [Mycobacteroides abscessus subsp. bolletii]